MTTRKLLPLGFVVECLLIFLIAIACIHLDKQLLCGSYNYSGSIDLFFIWEE